MESVLYSFILTLLNSIWQSALLAALYVGFHQLSTAHSPLFKRNLLYALLVWQIVLSILTFFIVHFNLAPFYVDEVKSMVGGFAINDWMQKNSSWLISAYLLVVAYKVSIALWQRHRLYSFYNAQLQKPSVELRLFTKEKAFQFGIFKTVEIWLSNRVQTPLTFGFWKPVILLPVALINQLSTQEAEALILHELTHIKAHDYLLNWLLIGAESVYFFNPFVLQLAQKIRMEREKNCDVQVLRFSYSNILYAESLLKTAQYKQEKLNLQLAAFQNKTQLLQRIQFFTRQENLEFRNNGQKRSIVAMLFIAFICLMIVRVGSIQTSTEKPLSTSVFSIKSKNPKIFLPEAVPTYSTLTLASSKVVETKSIVAPKNKSTSTLSLSLQKTKSIIKPYNDAEILGSNADNENRISAIAVTNIETNADEEKQIIINEETNTGKKITTAYRVILINGEWYLEPLWMVKDEQKPITDSLRRKGVPTKKDSVIVIIPTVQ